MGLLHGEKLLLLCRMKSDLGNSIKEILLCRVGSIPRKAALIVSGPWSQISVRCKIVEPSYSCTVPFHSLAFAI